MSFVLLMVVVVLALLQVSVGFLLPSALKTSRVSASLRMSTPENSDAINAIRAKMQADPNYNPMQDPEAMGMMESMIPDSFREFSNGIQRLKVAFADAESGQDAVEDLNASAAMVENRKDIMSAPQSTWMQQGTPAEDVNDDEAEDLLRELRAKNPQVPFDEEVYSKGRHSVGCSSLQRSSHS